MTYDEALEKYVNGEVDAEKCLFVLIGILKKEVDALRKKLK